MEYVEHFRAGQASSSRTIRRKRPLARLKNSTGIRWCLASDNRDARPTEDMSPQADSCSQLDRGRTPRFTALASTAPSGLCRIDHQSVRHRRFTQTRSRVRPAHRISFSIISRVYCFFVIILRRDR